MSNYVHNRCPHEPSSNSQYIYTINIYNDIVKKQSLEVVFWGRWTKQATIQSFILVLIVGVQKKLSPKDNSYKKMELYLTRGRCHYMTRGR